MNPRHSALTLDQAEYWARQGLMSAGDWAAYKHAWQTGACRFSQVCRCAACMAQPVCTCPETERDPKPCPGCLAAGGAV